MFHSCLGYAQKKIEKKYAEANSHFEQKAYNLAFPIYEKLQEAKSTDKEFLLRFGYCYLQSTSKQTDALKPFLKLLALDSDYNPILHYFLARAYHYNNDVSKAIEQLNILEKKLENKKGQDIIVFKKMSVPALEFLGLAKELKEKCKHVKKFFSEPLDAKIENLGKSINSAYGDYAPVISADENILVFTSRRKGNTGGDIDFEDNLHYEDIYISHKKKGKWTNAKNMGKHINSKTHEATVGISPDGKTIFLYIDKNGGDLYYSSFSEEKGDWKSPKPMTMINSKYREPSMTISPDGKVIYFSSDRPGGHGGLDIYEIHQNENGEWSKPQNLGDGINTDKNEDSPFLHFSEKTLYFSSEGHDSMGGYDIFFTEKIAKGNWTVPQNLGHPINSTQDDIHFVISADFRHGYYASARNKDFENFGEKDIYMISMPEYKTAELQTISFDVLLKSIPIAFDPILTPPVKMGLVTLSGSVKEEISNLLISARLSVIDLNTNQVVSEFEAVDPSGNYSTFLKQGGQYLLHVQKEGYMFYSEVFEIPKTNQRIEKVIHIKLKRIAKGRVAKFQVQFDYNSAKVKKYSVPTLKKLVVFLETNQKVHVEVGGHTDSTGPTEHNLQLSTQRAKAVYDFLIFSGIDEERLEYKGYGASKPIASNQTFTGRQLNRRTECKILEVKD